jgi:hypothetical protein
MMFGVEEEANAEEAMAELGRGRGKSREDRFESVAILFTLGCPGREQPTQNRWLRV